MQDCVRNDLTRSNAAFLSLVWPVIAEKCGGGSIKPVELMDDEISKDLDVLCGIDIWQTVSGSGCRGIASRVQFGDKNWRTFTIRKSRDSGARTEYEKRREAILSGGKYIFPYLTCQAYVSNCGNLIGCGLAKTASIINAIEEGRAYVNRTDNASFFVLRFCDIDYCYEVNNE